MTSASMRLTDEATATTSVATPSIAQPTLLSPDVVANHAGALRAGVSVLSADVAGIHNESLQIQLDARTNEAAKRSPVELLEDLSLLGFSWTGIARLVGVSIPAIRKWRLGESVSGHNRRVLARIVALVGVLSDDHLIADVPSWLEMPLGTSQVTGLDVCAAGHISDLIEYAANHINATELLERTVPDWKLDVGDKFEIFEADDGGRGIRVQSEAQVE